jgi:hypothetical protein
VSEGEQREFTNHLQRTVEAERSRDSQSDRPVTVVQNLPSLTRRIHAHHASLSRRPTTPLSPTADADNRSHTPGAFRANTAPDKIILRLACHE